MQPESVALCGPTQSTSMTMAAGDAHLMMDSPRTGIWTSSSMLSIGSQRRPRAHHPLIGRTPDQPDRSVDPRA